MLLRLSECLWVSLPHHGSARAGYILPFIDKEASHLPSNSKEKTHHDDCQTYQTRKETGISLL